MCIPPLMPTKVGIVANGDVSDFKNEIVQTEANRQSMQSKTESDEGDPFQNSPELDVPESGGDTGVLPVLEMAIQDIV